VFQFAENLDVTRDFLNFCACIFRFHCSAISYLTLR